MKDETDFNVDDVDQDALAAYREVAGKGPDAPADKVVETPAAKGEPVEKPSREQPVKFGKDEPRRGDEANKRMYPERQRAADGKFAKGTDEPADKVDAKPDATVVAKPAVKAADAPAEVAKPGGPPPSFSVKSKADWENVPQHIKDDIIKREQETSQGLAALKDFKDLKPYAEMAKSHNTTIGTALKHYVGMENTLRQDIGKGLAQIVQNYGYDQPKAAALFAKLAQQFGGHAPQTATSQQAPTGDPLLDALRPVMAPIMQQIGALQAQITGDRQAAIQAHQDGIKTQQMGTLSKAIDTFAADPANRFYPDLEEHITRLFETGMVPLTGDHASDLRTAYETAAQMHPEVREALIEQRLAERQAAERQKEQQAADKARNASRSITGSRVPGTVIQHAEEPNSHDDVEADVRRAYRSSLRG